MTAKILALPHDPGRQPAAASHSSCSATELGMSYTPSIGVDVGGVLRHHDIAEHEPAI